jgi:hypothetical protein
MEEKGKGEWELVEQVQGRVNHFFQGTIRVGLFVHFV